MRKKESLYQIIGKKVFFLKIFILSWIEPECWIIDKSAKTVLDVGCGQGLPMQLIKFRMKVEHSVGVDLFEPYIEECRGKNIHDDYLVSDVRELPYKDKSFDVVMALQVLEHLPKKDAWKLLSKMEKIARKQVIVATPIGDMYHPPVDGNKLQLHLSKFYPEEFEKRGYKVVKVGLKEIAGEDGIVHRTQNDILRKLIYAINIFITLLFYIWQSKANYYLVAYKNKFIND